MARRFNGESFLTEEAGGGEKRQTSGWTLSREENCWGSWRTKAPPWVQDSLPIHCPDVLLSYTIFAAFVFITMVFYGFLRMDFLLSQRSCWLTEKKLVETSHFNTSSKNNSSDTPGRHYIHLPSAVFLLHSFSSRSRRKCQPNPSRLFITTSATQSSHQRHLRADVSHLPAGVVMMHRPFKSTTQAPEPDRNEYWCACLLFAYIKTKRSRLSWLSQQHRSISSAAAQQRSKRLKISPKINLLPPPS